MEVTVSCFCITNTSGRGRPMRYGIHGVEWSWLMGYLWAFRILVCFSPFSWQEKEKYRVGRLWTFAVILWTMFKAELLLSLRLRRKELSHINDRPALSLSSFKGGRNSLRGRYKIKMEGQCNIFLLLPVIATNHSTTDENN